MLDLVLCSAAGGDVPVDTAPPADPSVESVLDSRNSWSHTGVPQLMEQTTGRPDLVVGVIDGPFAQGLPALAGARVELLSAVSPAGGGESAALQHGTFIAAMLCAARGGPAPAICPGCRFVHFGIFDDAEEVGGVLSADARRLADGIVECVDAGAEVINMSVAAAPSSNTDRALGDALTYAMHHGVVVVAAAGNDGTVASSSITRHPGVVPVVACDRYGRPLPLSNLSASVGQRGLAAPGDRIMSLDVDGTTTVSSGTSVATPFVTGTLALLSSLAAKAAMVDIVAALRSVRGRRRSIVPPLLNASAALMRLMPP